MAMSFRNIEFFLKEAFLGLSRNQLMSIVAIVTITISLLIYGTFVIGLYNFFTITKSLQSKLDVMVYLVEKVDQPSIEKLQKDIVGLLGVQKVEFISKQQAWAKFKTRFALTMELLGDNKKNPLPDAFKVEVTDVHYIDGVALSIKQMDNVEEVRYGYNLAQKLKKIIKAIQIGGTLLIVFMVIATLLIIVNTIRLTVLARQNEITIMQLVGATNNFIKWPFIIEGILLGLCGALLGTIMLRFGYNMMIDKVAQTLPFISIVTSREILTFIYVSVILIGTFLGMLGGYISVSRTLKKL